MAYCKTVARILFLLCATLLIGSHTAVAKPADAQQLSRWGVVKKLDFSFPDTWHEVEKRYRLQTVSAESPSKMDTRLIAIG
jgi:hypothetical protein